jgi:hypothetical protein
MNQPEKNEMGEACGTYDGRDVYTRFRWEILKNHLEDLEVDGRTISKWVVSQIQNSTRHTNQAITTQIRTATLDVTTALVSSMYVRHNELVVNNLWVRIVMQVEIYRALKSDIPEDGRPINCRNASGIQGF